ncbi:MAG: helicase-related protein, partial [Myxococcota bacterium]
MPNPLPIDAALPAVVVAARTGAFVVVAPPGTGKTTRVPPALVPEVRGAVWMLEPRRMAARAAARRIASERGEPVGRSVGYQVRYERVGGRDTQIWVVTDGVLLRRLQDDPLLDGIGAVLIDEVHERGLEVDLALALLSEVREARPDLVVGAMSATVDADAIARFLGGAPIVSAEAPRFPVTASWLPYPDPRPVHEVAADAVRALGDPGGDVLVFLPGVGEIRRTAERLRGYPAEVVALYGDLPADQQDAVLAGGRGRRVILATNVAETSVTVPGVTVVVDAGLARRPRLDPATGLDHLELVPVSRASADQRAGRAGRLGPGRVVRLWTEREHRARDAFDPPEVHRVDLCGPVLQLCAWGADPARFRWLDPPPPEALAAALATLSDLGAVDGRSITPLGKTLAALPLHPR